MRVSSDSLHLPRWLWRAGQIAVVAGIAVLLWWSVDWRASGALLAGADLRWLVAAAVALTVQTVLSALRWRLTAARLGIVIPVRTAIREYYLSQVVNQSLPGGVVGDAGRAVRARAQAGLLASGQAVVFERLAGQVGLLAVLAGGFVAVALLPGGIHWPGWVIVPVAAGFAVLALVVLWAGVAMRRAAGAPPFLRAFVHAVAARDILPAQAALSLATALCNVAAFGFCAYALGVDLPVAVLAALVPLILLAMVLPLSISGWGLREGAAAGLFPVVGAAASAGLATSVAFGLVFLATVLPGLVFAWLRPNAPLLRADRATYEG